jgi:phosphatidylinositol alpha-1,6-mannosyltransferase
MEMQASTPLEEVEGIERDDAMDLSTTARAHGNRALILAPSRGFGGGIERVADAVTSVWPGSFVRIDLYRAGRDAVPHGNRRAKARLAASALAAAVGRKWDWVLCLHVGLLPAALAAGRMARARVALMAYGTEVWGPMSPRARRLVLMCTRHIAISHFTARMLARRSTMGLEQVVVVPLGISRELARRAIREPVPRQESRPPTVITVSRLAPEHRYKGHFSVADAWPAVLAQHPGARWVVVGDGADRFALEARCRELGFEASVETLGRVSDAELAAMYPRAAVLALPSVSDADAVPPVGEGFGLVYAEAGAFAVPSIASTCGGGALEFVEEGITGRTVEPRDSTALAAAINELLANGSLRARLGERARARTLERHLPEHFASSLIAAIT